MEKVSILSATERIWGVTNPHFVARARPLTRTVDFLSDRFSSCTPTFSRLPRTGQSLPLTLIPGHLGTDVPRPSFNLLCVGWLQLTAEGVTCGLELVVEGGAEKTGDPLQGCLCPAPPRAYCEAATTRRSFRDVAFRGPLAIILLSPGEGGPGVPGWIALPMR